MIPHNNLLLTGVSGVGKTTLIREIATNISGQRIEGFISEMIEEEGLRQGWRLDSFDGEGGILAHGEIQSEYQMGKYGVAMSLFERMVDSHMILSEETDTYLIDEIGIIASWSPCFMTAMNALLDSDRKVIAVIRKQENDYIRQVKQRSDVELLEVTRENHSSILTDVLAWIDS